LNNEEQFRNEDEIDLSELVGVLFKRWITIIVVACLVIVAGITYSITKTKKYETSAIIEIGEYQDSSGNYNFIQDPVSASKDIKVIAKKIVSKKMENSNNEKIKFNVEDNFKTEVLEGSGAIEINLTSTKNFDSVSFINKAYNGLKFKHNKRFQQILQKKNLFKDQIEESTNRIDSLLDAKRSAVKDPKEPIALLLFNSEIQELRSYVNNLQNKVINLENVANTSFAVKPNLSNNPVSPKYKLFFAISMVLGLFLGVFAAFLREFWVMNRDKILGRENH